MTDLAHNEQNGNASPLDEPRKTGRHLAREFGDLVLEAVEAAELRYPPDADKASTPYLLNHQAVTGVLGAIRAVAVALPKDAEFRNEVLNFAVRAFQMTGGDPAQDEWIVRVLNRSEQDYRPPTPESKQRGKKAEQPDAPDAKKAGKK